MKLHNLLSLFFLGAFLFSCGSDSEDVSSELSLEISGEKREFQLGETITAQVNIDTGTTVDSVVYYLHNHRLKRTSPNEPLEHTFRNEKLGKWDLTAYVHSGQTIKEASQEIRLYNDAPPVSYSYEIVATYPHSPDAYTQGLEFHNGVLYESTGQYGSSSLRKVDYITGEVLQSIAIDDNYFAEGMTILDKKIFLLTWKEEVGLIYDLETFEKTGEFSYNESEEGWGLTNDGEKFYKSDGTERIWILDRDDLSEESYIQTVTHRTISSQLNELEWIEGKIYANTYQKDGVAIINPANGAIEGVINFGGLRDKLSNINQLDPVNDVLNGIAYDPATEKLYVTGKRWDKLFEVRIVEK